MKQLLALIKENLADIKENFYVIKKSRFTNSVLWHVPSLSIYALDPLHTEMFTSLLSLSSIEEVENWFKKYEIQLSELKEELKVLINFKNKIDEYTELNRLCLLVSQQCPLGCIYCYADHGTYNYPSLMDDKTAIKIIDTFSMVFNSIKTIQFFGGEPLLNLGVIEKTIEFIDELVKKGKLREKPKYFIETGLGVSFKIMEQCIDLLKREPTINVVASCDGPEEVQNILRPYKNGKPSFNVVAQNIDLLRQYNQPIAIEVTYTRIHQEKGILPRDLRRYFKKRFGISKIMIADVISKDNCIAIRRNERDYIELSEYLKDRNLVEEILNRSPNVFFCDMGFSNFTIDTKGDIYACHILTGIQEFRIGSIYEDIKQLEKKILQQGEILYKKRASKLGYTECRNCYLKYYCSDCLARRYVLNGEIKISFENCENMKRVIEDVLLEYVNNNQYYND